MKLFIVKGTCTEIDGDIMSENVFDTWILKFYICILENKHLSLYSSSWVIDYNLYNHYTLIIILCLNIIIWRKLSNIGHNSRSKYNESIEINLFKILKFLNFLFWWKLLYK